MNHLIGNVIIANASRYKGAYLPGLRVNSIDKVNIFLVLSDDFFDFSEVLIANIYLEFVVDILYLGR